MTFRVIAALDPPGTASFGSSPVVVQRDDALLVCGFGEIERIGEHELDQLVRWGQTQRIDDWRLEDEPRGDFGVGWIGSDFKRRARQIHAPALPTLTSIHRTPEGSSLSWCSLEEVGRMQERWLDKAARLVVEWGDRELADLMRRVRSDYIATKSAIYHTRTAEERRGELKWWTKLDNDIGIPTTEEELKRELEEHIATHRGLLGRVSQAPPDPGSLRYPTLQRANVLAA